MSYLYLLVDGCRINLRCRDVQDNQAGRGLVRVCGRPPLARTYITSAAAAAGCRGARGPGQTPAHTAAVTVPGSWAALRAAQNALIEMLSNAAIIVIHAVI